MTQRLPPSETEFLSMGSWWRCGNGLLVICCPKCAELIILTDEHMVDGGGLVTPSVKCSSAKCLYDEAVQLVDWQPPQSEELSQS